MYKNIAPYYNKLGRNLFSLKLWQQIKKKLIKGNYQPVRLLDIACGTGSVCIQAKKDGFKVDGLDISVSMINMAKIKAFEASEDINFLLSDMRAFNTGKSYEMITCLNDSMNQLLTIDEWQSVFRCVREHLRNGGLFIFDCSTLKNYKEAWNSFHMERNAKGDYLIQKSFYSDENRMATSTLTGFLNEEDNIYRGFEESFTQKGFESIEIIRALRDSGFYNNVITNLSFLEIDEPEQENKVIYICR